MIILLLTALALCAACYSISFGAQKRLQTLNKKFDRLSANGDGESTSFFSDIQKSRRLWSEIHWWAVRIPMIVAFMTLCLIGLMR